MQVLSKAAYHGARRRIAEVCETSNDTMSLRVRILEQIQAVVGFDAYAWLITDPQTCVGHAPLADFPHSPDLPRLIRLKYLTELNRWTTITTPPVARLDAATGGDLALSLLWRDLLRQYQVVDVASTVFKDRFGCWGFLDLWRSGSAPTFDEDEAAFLADIAADVTTALRSGQANNFVVTSSGDARRTGPVVLLLSPDLTVLGQTPETERYLRTLVPSPTDRSPIPATAYNVGAQLLAVEAGADHHLPVARMHLGDGTWVTVRAARIGDTSQQHDRNIAITIEAIAPSERLAVFALTSGLSPRETELLEYLATGSDTRNVAKQMFLSEHTVQDHLKSIFAKTSAHNRRTLLSRALGN